MRDEDLRTSLATVEGEAPAPEFLASLLTEVEAERDRARRGEEDLPTYAAELGDDDWVSAWPSEDVRPAAARRRVGTGVALVAAALVVIVGLVVVDSGENGSQVATRLAHGYATSDLPAAVIQGADGDVVIADDPTRGLDPIVPPWYRDERSTLDDLGFVGGLSVPFDLELPGRAQDCQDLVRSIHADSGVARLPCGGSSAALLFADDAAAVDATGVLLAHLESHSAGLYGQGVVLERVSDVEVQLGDEAAGFVLEQFIHARAAAQIVVVVWRTDNLVQVVWDIQDGGAPGGVDAVIDASESIERHTAVERRSGGD